MFRTRIARTALVAAAALFATACSTEGKPDDIVDESQGGVRGRIDVKGEQVSYESRVVDGVVSVRVIGADGTLYATWKSSIASDGMSGTFGGRSFGGDTEGLPADEASADVWREIAQGRVGVVLEALSAEGRRLDDIQAGEDPATSALRDLEPLLFALAELQTKADTSGPAGICSYAIGIAHTAWRQTRVSDCIIHHNASTARDGSTCNMNMYLRYYTASLGSATSTYTGNPSVSRAYDQYASRNGSSYCMYSKHWADNGGPGPFWNKQCQTCY